MSSTTDLEESVKARKAVVVTAKGVDKLYFVGQKITNFLNTHVRQNNHGSPNHANVVTGFQYAPKNKVVMIKGTFMKNGVPLKLSQIVGTLAEDQTLADEYVEKNSGDKATE